MSESAGSYLTEHRTYFWTRKVTACKKNSDEHYWQRKKAPSTDVCVYDLKQELLILVRVRAIVTFHSPCHER